MPWYEIVGVVTVSLVVGAAVGIWFLWIGVSTLVDLFVGRADVESPEKKRRRARKYHHFFAGEETWDRAIGYFWIGFFGLIGVPLLLIAALGPTP